MDRPRRGRGRDDFMDPFGGFGGFGGFTDPRSLMSSFFNRDPFDDPFFSRPVGSMLGRGVFGGHGFSDPFFSAPFGNTFPSEFIEQAPPRKSRGPVIEELPSDEEDNHQGKRAKSSGGEGSNNGPTVQHPDDEPSEVNNHTQQSRRQFAQPQFTHHQFIQPQFTQQQCSQPQSRSFSFHSSRVMHGGPNGAYYTSSTTRSVGGDGVIEEEHKEADTTTGKATHRVSRGLRNKGHSVTKKLNSDGNVDTVQMLHNLNQDELPRFKKDWEGNAEKHLPGWNRGFDALENREAGSSGQATDQRRGWALPSNQPDSGAEARRSLGKGREESGTGGAA